MNWFSFALLSAVLASVSAVVEKKVLFKEHAIGFAAVLAFVNAVIALPLFYFIDYSRLDWGALPIIFGITILAALAFLSITKAIRHMEVSSVSPLRMLSPAVVAGMAFFMLGESLTPGQVGGIILLVAGLTVLQFKDGFLNTLRLIKQSRYLHLVFLAILMYGVTSIGDRYVLTKYSFPPTAYIAFAHLFLAVVFFGMLYIFRDGVSRTKHSFRLSGWWILLTAILTVGYRFAHIMAVNMTHVGLVEAIKQTSVFFTILLGGELFHEKNLTRKLVASAIMIGGVLLIVL